MTEQFGSSYEELVFRALVSLGWREEDIVTQRPVAGGRSRPGGQVVDFLLYRGGTLFRIVEVDEEHWHRDPSREYLQDVQLMEWYHTLLPPVHLYGNEVETFELARATIAREIGRP
jgi:hypothetical protein